MNIKINKQKSENATIKDVASKPQAVKDLSNKVIKWLWDKPVPYIVLIMVVILSSIKVLELLETLAKDNDNIKYLIGAMMLMIVAIVVNRLTVLIKRK